MNLHITFKNMDTSDHLKVFIEDKSATLKKYFDGKISVNWILRIEKQSRTAHCHIVGNNMNYFGEGDTEDFKASIDIALDKIEKQIRKHKEIVTNHLHRHEMRHHQPVGV